MKVTLFILFFITVFFFNYSIEQTTEYPEEITENPQPTTEVLESTDTVITTQRPRPPQRRTTTLPNRVSTPVLISVPIAIAGATLLIGFGLIAYASRTGGNGIFFLTRTNERSIA